MPACYSGKIRYPGSRLAAAFPFVKCTKKAARSHKDKRAAFFVTAEFLNFYDPGVEYCSAS
ncbi:hypothetical protein [Dyadobacter sandarakinus]|uniref:Uncharacterized protein n=1 Tax=Dyadobacter sandarakinus TaxID=2747268 RepID=A0ABX7I5W1_9BACT|nr:hypothetical protein [Dyadobacter sandarakinus]QRR01259.1 hypothetical protein HWI92_10255 [Dyadobacter sandarakinus]